MKYFTCFLLLFLGFSINAQLDDITWTEPTKLDGFVVKTLVKNRNNYYVATVAKTPTNVIHFYHYSNGKLMSDNIVSSTFKGAIYSFEDIFVVNDQLYLFMSNQQVNSNQLLAQKIGDNCLPLGDPIVLTEQPLKTAFNSKSLDYKISVSPDEQFLSISYLYDNENVLKFPKFSTKIFNGNLIQLHEETFEVDYYLSELALGDIRLTNEGTQLILLQGLRRPAPNTSNFNSLDLYVVKPNTEKRLELLEVDDISFFNPIIRNESDSIYTIAYQYNTLTSKNKYQPGSKGVRFYEYYSKGDILSDHQELEFDKAYLLSQLDAKARKKYDKAQSKGKDYNLALFNYKLRNLFALNDGSRMLMMEESWTIRRSVSNGRMYTDYYLYNNNNMLLLKYDAQLVRDYSTIIPKMQVTRDDDGYYSSFVQFRDGNEHLYILFNDNLSNYDPSGEYIGMENPYSLSYNTKKTSIALVKFDIATGRYERSPIFQDVVKDFLVPRLNVISNHNMMLCTFNNRNVSQFAQIFFHESLK